MNKETLKNKVKEHWNNNPMDYDNIKSKKYSKEYYDEINKQFRNVHFFAQKKKKKIFSKIINYKNIKNKTVLIIGCGCGTLTTEMVKSGAKVTAIDITPTAIKNTKRQLKENKLKAIVFEADAEQLPFKNESFDFVWSWGVIHHTPNTKKAAQEILRVLKKGCHAKVMIYHKNSIFYYILIMFIRGILQGKLLFQKPQELLNKYTDHSHKGGTPLGKTYTSNQAKKLFSGSKNIKTQVYGLRNELYFIPHIRNMCYKLPDLIPKLILEKLRLGWFLVLKIKK